jgi:hypothetical protein
MGCVPVPPAHGTAGNLPHPPFDRGASTSATISAATSLRSSLPGRITQRAVVVLQRYGAAPNSRSATTAPPLRSPKRFDRGLCKRTVKGWKAPGRQVASLAGSRRRGPFNHSCRTSAPVRRGRFIARICSTAAERRDRLHVLASRCFRCISRSLPRWRAVIRSTGSAQRLPFPVFGPMPVGNGAARGRA